MHKTLVLFSNDLRLHDNAALQLATHGSSELLCLYIKPSWYCQSGQFGYSGPAKIRDQFLEQSLTDLSLSLNEYGQQLWVAKSPTVEQIRDLLKQNSITRVVSSRTADWYQSAFLQSLRGRVPDCEFHELSTQSLFEPNHLPFAIADLPPTFSKFRKIAERLRPESCIEDTSWLAPPLNDSGLSQWVYQQPEYLSTTSEGFVGGETAGLGHLDRYFSSTLASSYKEVRNSLDGFDNSTKFSPWLANGSLSVRRIYSDLKSYESQHGANESTYWIYFELLWREFFHLNACRLGKQLFAIGGSKSKKTLTSYYPERFHRWANGNTPYPLVNAIMSELSETGYISNRARQITASCFVNELSMDWRYGAAYFERSLIDYDVASNWGNWQYLAGVGADVQPKRHFNLEKQAAQFDPNAEYINKWSDDSHRPQLDSVDAADWPIL